MTLTLVLLTACVRGSIFEQFEKEMMEADAQQAVLGLSEALLEKVEDRPKEIEIVCPGDVPPKVTIRDLISEAASSFDGGECMVLKLTGMNFNFRLSLNCEEMSRAEMRFNDEDGERERDGDGEEREEAE
jgi:hypothetical protein